MSGEICGFPLGRLIREFGLNDFLENQIQEEDTAFDIVVKALAFFCEEANPRLEVFKFGVLTVGSFLNAYYKKRNQPPQQALRDLVTILQTNRNDDQIRAWIQSHFG